MLDDDNAELGFKPGDGRSFKKARDRNHLVADGAMQVIVMRTRELKAGAPVVDHHLRKHPIGHKLFGGTKHRREVSLDKPLREAGVKVLQRLPPYIEIEPPGSSVPVFHA